MAASRSIEGRLNIGGQEHSAAELAERCLETVPGRRFAYITDSVFSAESLKSFLTLGPGVDELWCEACFYDAPELAAEMGHFSIEQTAALAEAMRARRLYPIHVSRRYQGWALYRRHLLKARETFKNTFRPPIYKMKNEK